MPLQYNVGKSGKINILFFFLYFLDVPDYSIQCVRRPQFLQEMRVKDEEGRKIKGLF